MRGEAAELLGPQGSPGDAEHRPAMAAGAAAFDQAAMRCSTGAVSSLSAWACCRSGTAIAVWL